MWSLIDERLGYTFRAHPAVRERLAELEAEVDAGRRSAASAAEELLRRFAGAD